MHEDLIKIWNTIKPEERQTIFRETGEREGLPASAIEKDWWVTTALRIVFSLPVAEHLVFKGGSSLSKGWNLIERFSEDIDLTIDREFLGFEEELSKTQVKKLRKASCLFISNDFANAIVAKIEELEIPELTLTVQDFKDSDTDPLVVELNYKSLTDILEKWKADYIAMQENMIYGDSKSFEELITSIEVIKERFRKIE